MNLIPISINDVKSSINDALLVKYSFETSSYYYEEAQAVEQAVEEWIK